MLLKIENTVTHSVYEYDVEDKNNGKKLYFQFDINSLNLDDGEYKLYLFNGDNLIYTDILKIGNYNPDTLQYNKGANTYINIDYNVKLEAKNEQINDVSTVIYPDDGFDAMTSVNVDAQPLYNTAYSSGYNSGEADGYSNGYSVGEADGYNRGIDEGSVDLSFIGYDRNDSNEVVNQLIYTPAELSKTYYENWDENRTNVSYYFENSDIVIAPLINTENVENMNSFFRNCDKLLYVPSLSTSRVKRMNSMFVGCTSLKIISPFDTSSLSGSIGGMFQRCSSLEEIPYLDTSRVTGLTNTFAGCASLKSLPNLNTSNVQYMNYTFSGCTSLEELPKYDFSNVVEIYDLCYNCNNLLTVPSLELSAVTDATAAFAECYRLKTVGEFSAPNCTTVENMFGYCYDLETIGSYEHYLDIGKCSTTSYMFRDCYSLKELPIINCPSITTESSFFGGTYYLYDLVEVGGCISKHNQNGTNKWARCPNLSQASIQRIINCLYDFIGNGSSTRKSISFNTNSQSLVTNEMIAQATNKGWTIDFKSPSHSN